MTVIKNRLFWVIIGFFTLASILQYSEIIGIPADIYPNPTVGLTRHTLDRILFLVPIINAAFLFRKRGAIITALAALVVMLPPAISVFSVNHDALAETLVVFAVGIMAAWGVWFRLQERDETQLALDQCQYSHEILQHYVHSIRKNEKRQAILNTISSLLGESLELKITLDKAVQMVSELMEVESTIIFSLEDEVPKLRVIAYEGVSDEFVQSVDGMMVGEGIYGEVARTCQPMVIEDAADDPRMALPAVQEMQIVVQLIVPMIIKSRIRGVLCVGMRRPRKYTPEDIDLLTSVGTQIATAIENARLYEKEHQAVQRLAISERNYRQLFEKASDAIWVHDMDGNIMEVNEAAAKLVGYSVDKLKTMNIRQFLSSENIATFNQIRHQLLERETLKEPYESQLIRKDGTEVILKITTNLVVENGHTRGFQSIARDVTQQKRAEEMLNKIIDGTPLPTLAINKQHKVTHWNIAIESISGIKKEDVMGTDEQWRAFYSTKRPIMSDLIVNGSSEEEIMAMYDNAQKSDLIDGAYEAESFFPDLSEGGKWLHFTASPIRDDTGEIIGAIEALRNVTEGRKMQERLRYYLGQITQVQEEERRRIARDLHDDTSQALFALARQLDSFTRNNEDLPASTAAFLTELRQQVKTILEGIRRFTQELRPPMLDDLGLIATLRWEADEFERHSGTKANLIVSGQERRFSEHVELHTFRIIQEALRNVERHAMASKVEIKIKFNEGNTIVSVSDNGKGFNIAGGLTELPQIGKLGLTGMEERVRLLGATIKIESKPGKGTKITVKLPL